MNDSTNQYTEIKGKHYRYDPDHDCYHRCYTPEEVQEHTRDTLWIVGITTAVMVVGILYEIFVK